MEDIDNINISILNDLGCNLTITTFSSITSEDIVLIVSTLLNVINNSKLPKKLPDGKASRFRICTDISDIIKNLGYTQSIGYENFLYPNEKEIRILISWLISKLPKVDEVEIEGLSNSKKSKKILISLENWKNNINKWNKYNSNYNNNIFKNQSFVSNNILLSNKTNNLNVKSFYSSDYLKPFSNQISNEKVIPSIMEYHTREIAYYLEAQSKWNSQGLEAAKEAQLLRKKALLKSINDAFKSSVSSLAQNGAFGNEIKGEGGEGGSLGYSYDPTKSMADILQGLVQSGGSDVNATAASTFTRRNDFGQEKETVAHVVEGVAGGAAGTIGTVVQVVEDSDTGGMKQVQQEDEDAIKLKREEELSELHAKVNAELEAVNTLKKQIEAASVQQKDLETEKKRLEDANNAAESEYKTKKQTLDLLPDASKNLNALTAMVESSKKRLTDFQKQWEEAKLPYIEEYNRKKNLMANRKEECRLKLDQIKRMRDDMKDMVTQLREKDETYAQVVDELNRLPKAVNRQVYVKRIMDIVRNLERQTVDIKKILDDIRDVQKDINTVTDTSHRSFALADDMIFKNAQTTKDPAAAKSYAKLVELRDKFDDLIKTVKSVGSTRNEISDLEARTLALRERNVNLNMERVQADFDAVKAENAALAKQLGLKKF